jgi:hypothetical protein
MSERLGFALVLLVAVASVASLLFLSGTSATGNVARDAGISACADVRCPNHAQAYPLLDVNGYVLRDDSGEPACVCPPR